jgi:23S rRNA pseudouridine1911/1915/1917 synthase
MGMTPEILYEDNHLIAVHKPAGVASAHYDGGGETVDRMVKAYLKAKYQKPGNVFLGVVHRLDRLTSGVLLFARTSKAAARLGEQFKGGTAKKVYWAVVKDSPAFAPAGGFEDTLLHDDDARLVRVVPPGTPGAKAAKSEYTVLRRRGGHLLLELRPRTGRKHQLRVQLASRGHPIWGDTKYGSTVPLDGYIALHAKSLTVSHPVSREAVELTADVPAAWKKRFAGLIE